MDICFDPRNSDNKQNEECSSLRLDLQKGFGKKMVLSILVFGCDLLGSASPAPGRSCLYGCAIFRKALSVSSSLPLLILPAWVLSAVIGIVGYPQLSLWPRQVIQCWGPYHVFNFCWSCLSRALI
ncbi:hypothetical protein Bca4012_026322 [Brassica carinata]